LVPDAAVPGATRVTRAELFRWAGWFAMANGALAALIGLRYLFYYDLPADSLGASYTVLAYTGHYASLGLLTVLPVLPLIALWPRRALAVVPAVLLGTALVTLLMVDANVFAEHRYHLTVLTVAIFAPATWAFIAVIGGIALVFQFILAASVSRWVAGARRRGGLPLGLCLALAWLAGQGIHIWGDALGLPSVTQLTRYLPAYFPIHSRRGLARLGLVDPAAIERQRLLARARQGAGGGQLRYPLAPLRCRAGDPPQNLLVVLIDGLRPDAVTPGLMPNLAAFRTAGQDFANHYSGGNSTRAGVFSAFYGLPSTYVDTFYAVQQPPVLVTELQRRHYDFGLFSAPGFGTPMDMDRTVFAGMPGLPAARADLSGVERNTRATDEWLAWLGARDGTAPFFGLVYFDPPTGAMSTEPDPSLPMNERFAGASERVTRVWRAYRRAMQFTDRELGRVLGGLRDSGLAQRTVVVVLSDHGYEFGETDPDLLGHASNYSAAQIRAVLAIDWPGRLPTRHVHRTSHHDLPVTLLQDLLGCENLPADYSIGRNLFAGLGWDWIPAGSYQSWAIISPESIVVAHPGGFMEQLDSSYRPLDRQPLDTDVIRDALSANRRFYR